VLLQNRESDFRIVRIAVIKGNAGCSGRKASLTQAFYRVKKRNYSETFCKLSHLSIEIFCIDLCGEKGIYLW